MKIERRKNRQEAQVFTASLNDIMFFLLLFFLIISTMVTPMAIKVMLPKSSTSQQISSKKSIGMVVTADRRYFINDLEVPFSEVESTLAFLAGEGEPEDMPNVLLQIENSVDIQSVVRIIDIGNRLNLKVTILVDKE